MCAGVRHLAVLSRYIHITVCTFCLPLSVTIPCSCSQVVFYLQTRPGSPALLPPLYKLFYAVRPDPQELRLLMQVGGKTAILHVTLVYVSET